MIYILDDDEAMADSMFWLVTAMGFSAKVCLNPDQFIKAYQPELNDKLIVDIRMPEISPYEFRMTLKKHNIKIPLIYVSALVDDGRSDLVKTLSKNDFNEVLGFLSKPFEPEHLQDLLAA